MAVTDLPPPTDRPPEPAGPGRVDVAALAADLRRRVDGGVRFDEGTRGAYSTDASNYRMPPLGVVEPCTVEAAVEAAAVCREHGVPLLSRGGGTSLAGQTTNAAVVLDWSRHCNRLLELDTDRRTCVVEPGIVLDHLDARLAGHGLTWGPQPATHWTCTVGGMLGNNACGASAQVYGKAVDKVSRLEVLLADGTRMWVGPTSDEEYDEIIRAGGRPAEVHRGLRELRDRYLAEIRTGFPRIPRRVSGYNLDALLPENGFDVARALVGSEGTLVTVLRAELQLSELPRFRRLAVLGYRDVVAAGGDVARVLPHRPHRLEGVDEVLRRNQDELGMNPRALEKLPGGSGWLLVELAGDVEEELAGRLDGMIADLRSGPEPPEVLVLTDPQDQADMWAFRESGLGATAHPPDAPDTWPGWEDSAVAPEQLGDYLADLRALLDRHGLTPSSLYGHFGHGCVHLRIPFPLGEAGGEDPYRSFLEDAADLVARYGGSMSGEHGDGQVRGELLPRMFAPELVEAFGRTKALLDPQNRMNPGKVVAPYPLDEHLRLTGGYPAWEPPVAFAYPEDGGSFANAAARCVGVGKCRSSLESASGQVMCPSYQVTGDEEHSTRGRARLLFEMLRGDVIRDRWRSTAVRDALDLCLACKGCRSDCPVDVDMATYKAEFLSHHYAGRLRPRTHYTLGWLPLVARVAALAPRVVNVLTQTPVLRTVAKRVGGVTPERDLPLFAPRRFTSWYRERGPRGTGERGEVLLWPDTFTEFFQPHIGQAAVTVLEDAGFTVRIPDRELCCGLTWISTGQLGTASRILRRTAGALAPDLRAGTPVLALEPSCTAVFRSDAPELLPDDEDVRLLAERTRTLAELLGERAADWAPPAADRAAVVQTHCHHHSIMGFDSDRELMRRAGFDADVLDSGCCGLAGNFGFERGHHDVSMACAEQVLLPTVRQGDPQAVVLADGFSCRTQVEQGGTGRRAVHLAEALAGLVTGARLGDRPEQVLAPAPRPPGRLAQALALAAAAGATGAAVGGLVTGVRRVVTGGRP
ncbi:FAD-binding oxidoreductase [Blastococcus sp. MG754426]|uniref:FAD-binding and (Fe-S)-binding domain-containing protein n=1 Tax=unclassified Blastococcus TaxID=2619396 RepID=UPI001EF1273B|nr:MULTISPECIES: FAD-binding and (Fe-S)-binding domain-containing protein [unclassified Blastococcus]MCF6506068.1 FAD-binding oxidoreductase [Blastococcus sp. MG754426]MCF6510546.1 FAD-binding oxidoreductase [Blastococcus sp. MG754427]